MAHEINNPLAIILATSGVIKDRLNPEFKMDCSTEALIEELSTIDAAVIRARGITQQLLDYGRKNMPHMVATDVNQILSEILSGYKSREFELADIALEQNLSPPAHGNG